MGELTRRHVLRSAAATGGAAALTGLGDSAVEAAAGQPRPDCRPVPGAVTVSPDDFRYPSLNKSHNGRFTPRPDAIIAVYSPGQAVRAVEDAVRAGKRIAVRSGGHCYEDFVTSADVRIVLDVSQLDQVSFDPEHQAFSVEAGATLGKVYKDLYYGWGVTIPAAAAPASVSAGTSPAAATATSHGGTAWWSTTCTAWRWSSSTGRESPPSGRHPPLG